MSLWTAGFVVFKVEKHSKNKEKVGGNLGGRRGKEKVKDADWSIGSRKREALARWSLSIKQNSFTLMFDTN